MKFFARMLQQALDVTESLDVLQRETAVAVTQGPVFAAAYEYSRMPIGYRLRPGMASMIGCAAIILCHANPLDPAPQIRPRPTLPSA